MPLTGEAKRIYQRDLMRKRRLLAKAATLAVTEITQQRTGRPRVIPGPVMAMAQGVLREALDRAQAPLDRVVGKAAGKLEARRYVTSYETVEGKSRANTIEADDNDAQLRATEILIGLHERAGTIPSAAPLQGGVGQITVIEVNYHPTQDVVRPAIDADCEDVTPL